MPESYKWVYLRRPPRRGITGAKCDNSKKYSDNSKSEWIELANVCQCSSKKSGNRRAACQANNNAHSNQLTALPQK